MTDERLLDNRVNVDLIDGILAMNRQRIILELIDNGQLDTESGIALFKTTTRPDIVAEDRKAFEEGEFGCDSPSGRLATLFSKLKPLPKR